MKKRILAALLALQLLIPARVSAASAATIDPTQLGSLEIYKYDMTGAAQDGVWDGSYVSTGVRDTAGVETILGSAIRSGNTDSTNKLGNGGVSYGYALQGVQFSYLKVADLYSAKDPTSLCCAMADSPQTEALLTALGLDAQDCASADDGVFYFQSDTLSNGLRTALTANATALKNRLEAFMQKYGGNAMPETDAYGHTAATDLPLGLYLCVETGVPEMVTDTTAPFLVSIPMTSVNGTNATDGGSRWLYDVTLYPKNLTGVPTLEKTVREAGQDGTYAHTATASSGDHVQYQITSTLPTITSAATYLTEYRFTDTLAAGLSYCPNEVELAFYRDAACTDLITVWGSDQFDVRYTGSSQCEIMPTAAGLQELCSSKAVYGDAVLSGYSGCTLRITYRAKLNTDDTVVCGDDGNPNTVTLSWKRSSGGDTLMDDCHVYSYGLDLSKQFSDRRGVFSKVEFLLHNDTDDYYVTAALQKGTYLVTGQTAAEADATHLVPTEDGRLLVKGLEDDVYTLTEVQTDSGYTLLQEPISIAITSGETETLCRIYSQDTLGVVQNDPRNTTGRNLAHALCSATARVNGDPVTMLDDGESGSALVPLTVMNTRGFDLPRTGDTGSLIYPLLGMSGAALALGLLLFGRRKKD